eukprot:9200210-Alexandrium_andersonii.AAC.1
MEAFRSLPEVAFQRAPPSGATNRHVGAPSPMARCPLDAWRRSSLAPRWDRTSSCLMLGGKNT